MSSSIYRKLAFTNIKNNRRTYVPYLLTCVFTLMMFYTIVALTMNEGIKGVPGEENFRYMLFIGVVIVAIFSVIFLFYTNSFLIKQRKKEIGIYNVLGLGKRHIARMLTVEMLVTVLVSFGGGILGGILFGKLIFLILLRILHFDAGMTFAVEPKAIGVTLLLFGGIFFACLCYNLFQIQLANPVELLRGGNVGEKEPKTKLIMTAVGVLTMGGGYYIALTVENPMEVLGMFFVAVILVIIGTYALFTAGSIALLKILRKNKNYYYKTKHFTSVSGMMYRMKQNAAGLANICILSTMVLVMISSTAAMYVGMDDILKQRFPRECIIEAYEPTEENKAFVDESLAQVMEKHNLTGAREVKYSSTQTSGGIMGNKLYTNNEVEGNPMEFSEYGSFKFLTADEYNRLEGKQASLAKDEVLIYGTKSDITEKEIQINGNRFQNRKIKMKNVPEDTQNMWSSFYIVMADQETIDGVIGENRDYVSTLYYKAVDFKGKKEDREAAYKDINAKIVSEDRSIRAELRETERDDFYSLYGTFLFMGIFFGSLFLMATVLIIYYKQISEGYNDKTRFEIMRKVGMSRKEVKQSIRSQVLSVFFLPLLMAIVHIAAAFKVITKLLNSFNLTNKPLIFQTTVVTVIVFAMFYGVVYAVTTKEYYKIVES